MHKKSSVIFVCLGNICRSPLAQGIAKKYVKEKNLDIEIFSAGTSSWHEGEAPCENSIKVAKKNGIDISNYKASQIKKEDIDKYDFVIALDDSNVANLKKIGFKNILKIGNFGFDGADVPDPYFFKDFEGFDKVFEMINICTMNFIETNFIGKK